MHYIYAFISYIYNIYIHIFQVRHLNCAFAHMCKYIYIYIYLYRNICKKKCVFNFHLIYTHFKLLWL